MVYVCMLLVFIYFLQSLLINSVFFSFFPNAHKSVGFKTSIRVIIFFLISTYY